MFQSARLKLTAWYLLIIMLISIAFSIVIYRVLTSELDRVERLQRFRQERQLDSPFLDIRRAFPHPIDPQLLTETKNRLGIILLAINMGILGASSLAGYFLAGQTLKPIKNMIDEQNRFITDASHELRTPLTSLKSEIEVNLRDEKLNLKQARQLLESNLEEVNNLQALSDNLIRLTQNQNINVTTQFLPVSIKSVLDDASKKVFVLVKHKGISIKKNIQDFTLEADKQSLIEVFVILLDNAIKYSPKGKEVVLATKKTDGLIEISVTDQGIGISDEDLPHLFGRFYRADKSRTKVDVPGYGLGLSIAKQIIEKHKGLIKASSRVGKGTVFSVQLPIKH